MNTVPEQILPDSKKNLDWVKKNVSAYESLLFFEYKTIRANYYNKVANQNLRRGIINPTDFQKVIDPHGLGLNSFPADLKHVGIGNSRITALVGEHMSRPFDFRAIISSGDEFGISMKERNKKEAINAYVQQKLIENIQDPQKAQMEIQNQADFFLYEWQDQMEIAANIILNYYYQQQNLEFKFNQTFEDFLVFGESIMTHQKLSGEMVTTKENCLRCFYLADSESTTEEGLEVFVRVSYQNPSSLQDKYYDHLSVKDTEKLQQYRNYWATITGNPYPKIGNANTLITVNEEYPEVQLLSPTETEQAFFGSPTDIAGNVRELWTLWKSKRKLKEIESFDDFGIPSKRLVHEKYKLDLNREVFSKDVIINEWWQATMLGGDIYCNYGPIDYLNTSLENISKQEPPVTIQQHNFNNSKAQSLMDIIKPFDFWYDEYAYRRELLVNLLKPDILVYNTTMIPEDLDEQEFMNLIETTGTAPENPARAIPTGPSMGRAAGNLNNTTMLRYVQGSGGKTLEIIDRLMAATIDTMDTVCGVTQQRLGEINQRDAVNNVQTSIQRSTYSTEKWFYLHEEFKRRVMKKTLNIGKEILRENPQKLAWIMNDNLQQVITDEQLRNIDLCEFDILTVASSKYEKIRQKIENLFEKAISSGQGRLSQVADIYMSSSLMAGVRKLKIQEEKSAQMQQQQEANKIASNERIAQQAVDLEYAKIDAEITKALISNSASEETSQDVTKIQEQIRKDRELNFKERQAERQNSQDEKMLALKEKELEIKKKQANKPNKS